jgi:23S rRNA U2552 (ribose-2'-O)-methylase RlmE/FtsJ
MQVLIQANPRYTGVVEIDAPIMNAVVNHAIQFGEKFVKPGATFICKVMHFTDTPLV